MAHYGSLGNQCLADDVRDVRGAIVRSSENERLGIVNDVIFDHDSMEIHYVVVDSGGWLEAGSFLLPVDRVSSDKNHGDGLATSTTRKQIKSSPQYDERSLHPKGEWKKFEQEFNKYWEDQPVMHIKGSDRIITPPEEPTPALPGSTAQSNRSSASREVNAAELFPKRMADVFPDPAPGSGKVTLRPREAARVEQAAAGVNQLKPRWWDAFDNYLRLNKNDIQATCSECSSKVA